MPEIADSVVEDLLSDYENWKTRPEIVGENNISNGASISGNYVEARYGYYGNAAEWNVGNLHMSGGAGQTNCICLCFFGIYPNQSGSESRKSDVPFRSDNGGKGRNSHDGRSRSFGCYHEGNRKSDRQRGGRYDN